MSHDIDHDRCSELLGPFVRGELGDGDARAVETHLETCAQCRSERAALVALRPTDADALTGDERARLRAGVRAALGRQHPSQDGGRSTGDVIPLRRGARFGRAAGALGLAAVALVVAVAVATLDLAGGGDDAAQGGGGGATARSEGAADGGPRPRFLASEGRLPLRVLQSPVTRSAEAADGDGEDATAEDAPLEDDALDGAQRFRARASTVLFGSYAEAYDVGDARALRAEFTDELARAAPSERVGDQLRACVAEVARARDGAQLPVFATADRRSLVVGFVWSEGGDALDSFMLWTWRRGSCERPTGYHAGPIGA
ncbi:MAG TPA: zf-HC2 domain-containing protein [Actinomycetota bacterium]|nr:zf-HC2 domain-containing protein [Actinomycetota bacterium]